MAARVEYVVVWHGALHRTYPQPTVAVPAPRTALPDTAVTVLGLIGPEWISRSAIVARAHMRTKRVGEHLVRLVDDGRIERKGFSKSTRGRIPTFYRRVGPSADGQDRFAATNCEDCGVPVRQGSGGVCRSCRAARREAQAQR